MHRRPFVASFLVVLAAVLLVAQQVPPPVKFVTSDVEQLKLDKIQLETAVVVLKKQLADAEYQLAQGCALPQEIGKYTAETLKAHGNPEGVTFDVQALHWKVTPDPKKDK